ncbi:hypothetical protein [Dulcicalothrix desertica]|uniref:hypothetical protein n=1 Tax=Dulcicalothrix desertica TaxID=32056 RepID=UPI001646136D|nr:hypothetical protein [Dulcicalothrix desertica]
MRYQHQIQLDIQSTLANLALINRIEKFTVNLVCNLIKENSSSRNILFIPHNQISVFRYRLIFPQGVVVSFIFLQKTKSNLKSKENIKLFA